MANLYGEGIKQRVVMGREWPGYWVGLEDESGGNRSYLSRNPSLEREQAARVLDDVSEALERLEAVGDFAGCIFRVEVLRCESN